MNFPRDWSVVRLGDIVLDMQPGFAQRPTDDDSGIGQIRTHNVTPDGELSLADLKYVTPSEKEDEKYVLRRGDVVFNNTNSDDWVGKTALYDIDEPLFFSNHMTRIRTDEKQLLPDFLASYLHFLWETGYSKTRAKRWVSQAAVDQRELANFKVPRPTIIEQRRIVEIIKQSNALRDQRRRMLEVMGKLQTPLFLEVFGPPAQWNRSTIKLGNITTFITSGSRDWSQYYSSSHGDAKFIRVQNIKTGELDLSDMAYVKPPENTEAERAKVYPGDLLISITGTVGQVAIAPSNIGEAYISQHVALVRTNGAVAVDYLVEFLNHPTGGQLQLQRVNYGQTKPGLNLQQIKDLMIPVFDQNEIDKFLIYRSNMMNLKNKLASTAAQFNELQEATMQEVFKGQLTSKWRKAHQQELETWMSEQEQQPAPRKRNRVLIEVTAPPERTTPSRTARHWLMDQLSEVQGHVYRALQEWKGTLIPSEDLDRFLAEWPISHLTDAHDRVLRILSQLAGLGLIACVSVATESGDYVTAYRVLREDELTLLEDRWRLGAPA